MKIKINENNIQKLEQALAQANGNCRERLAHADDLYKAVDRIREKFDIPKSRMEGIQIRVDLNSQSKPHAYKHAMYSTFFTVEFSKTDAYLVDCERDYTEERFPFRVINFPDSAKEAICEKYNKFGLYC